MRCKLLSISSLVDRISPYLDSGVKKFLATSKKLLHEEEMSNGRSITSTDVSRALREVPNAAEEMAVDVVAAAVKQVRKMEAKRN